MTATELREARNASQYPGTADMSPEAIASWRELHYLPADPADVLRPDPARCESVQFDSDGYRLAGHLYRPPNVGDREATAGVVMVGPASSVKEQTLPHYAGRFADAGFTVLAFDSRSYGESGGEPRCWYDPNQIISDYSNAIGYLSGRPDVNAERVAAVGVCMGGGYAVSTAAQDRRVRAVASIGGGFNIGATFVKGLGAGGFADWMRSINDRAANGDAGEVQYVPAVAPDPTGGLAFMPNEEAYSYYMRTSAADAPSWENRVAVKSLQPYFIYDGIPHAALLASTPLLVVHGTNDPFLLPEYAQAAYDAATGPKDLIWIETHNHIEIYDQRPIVEQAAKATIDWLGQTLQPKGA
jgi:fermentation-respiration switch protein FrsA (DUF1100 family)